MNIPIGSRVRIDDEYEEYIFYGYNYDMSMASCFPIKSTIITDKMVYVPIKAILSISSKSNIENEIENLKL
jgi:hypothetical protein